MALNRDDIEVIQHYDKKESGNVIHSTTIKVVEIVDGKEILFTILSDKLIPISEEMTDSGTVDRKLVTELWALIHKEVTGQYPEKSKNDIDTIVSGILYIIQGTRRHIVSEFQGPHGIYRQVKTKGNYHNR